MYFTLYPSPFPLPALLLALETATDVCSVALVDEGRVVGLAETAEPRSHAARLVPLVRDLLAEHGIGTADLSAVAVSAGPGSYTGLRIGASTAKGLAWAHGLDLVAVPSLEALAAQAAQAAPETAEGDALLVAFPSRRGEVYAAFFHCNNGNVQELRPASALALADLDAWLPDTGGVRWVVGPAGGAVADALSRPAHLLGPAHVRPSAEAVGRLGWARWQAGAVEDVAAFEPAYLKAFVAKRGGSIFERLPR